MRSSNARRPWSSTAHADQAALVAWERGFRQPPRTWLVHGEPSARRALADRFKDDLGLEVDIAERGRTVILWRPRQLMFEYGLQTRTALTLEICRRTAIHVTNPLR